MSHSSLRRAAGYAALAHDAYRLSRAEDEQVARAAREHLIQRMGRLRGLPQKLGQMLSFSTAAEERDATAAAQFAQLQEAAEPLPLRTIRTLLEQQWRLPLENVLAEIEPQGRAASLGQVHRARLLDGTPVAIKVQYPGIRQSVLSDLKMLGWLSAPVGSLRRGFDLSAYRQTILADLEQELDYQAEARRQTRVRDFAGTDGAIIVPRVHESLSTATVLVTAWEDGDHWREVPESYTHLQRRQLAGGLLRFFLRSLLVEGALHADWHPGNVRFRRQGDSASMVLYDFGSLYEPTRPERLALARLIRATLQRDEAPLRLMIALGFNPEFLQPLEGKLPALCRVLFEPFAADYPYPIQDWRIGERVRDILGDDRWNFRIAGPPALVFLLRAFEGLRVYLSGLAQPIAWRPIVNEWLAELAEDLDGLPLPTLAGPRQDFRTLANHLKIRVRQQGRTKVELTAYASAIDDLDELLDDDIRGRIATRQIDLAEIVSDVRRRGYVPGPVFQLTEGERTVDVWLE